MPQVSKSSGSRAPVKAVVLFGVGDDGRPQAGLFPESQAALAKKVAKQLGLTAVDVSAPDLTALGAKIPAGRLYANRRSIIPAVRRDVHEKLLEFARTGSGTTGASRASGSGGQPADPPAGIPKDWDNIAPGHQVIAQSSLEDGWWEAIVVARDGDILTLKWRDSPRESSFRMHFAQVALQQISPAA
jgi:hypothetical protein